MTDNNHDVHEPFEPLDDHLADTGKVVTVRGGQSRAGILFLMGAGLLTLGTAALLLTGDATPTPDLQPNTVVQLEGPNSDLAANTLVALQPTTPPVVETNPDNLVLLSSRPTLDPALAQALLGTPIASSAEQLSAAYEVVRDTYNPFTIVPDRPRGEVVQYEVEAGDTIMNIADEFGLEPESIAWGNDRGIVNGIRPGQVLNILPVDGVYWTVLADQTIADVAARFSVDPYVIIDSEYNDLFGRMPEDTLPTGLRVIVPGGQGEAINWTPVVERRGESSSNGGGSGAAGQIIFEPSDPGSCGWVDNPGAGGGWANPVPSGYQFSQGYSGYHQGVDLAATSGTSVAAATGGSVIFAGPNSYGYGNLIVIASGPYTTVYGHLSAIYVGCQQYVSAGQAIGAVGQTGQATGPHLHFEIRVNDTPTDPTFTIVL